MACGIRVEEIEDPLTQKARPLAEDEAGAWHAALKKALIAEAAQD